MTRKMKKIFYKGILTAIHLRKFKPGSHPITDASESLQVMTLKHKKGDVVAPHIHTPKRRVTKNLQECLIIRKGKIRVDLYGAGKKPFTHLSVKTGEALIILGGGHAVKYLAPTEIIELKNGPYISDKEML